jgi:hypothetical protein
MIDGWSDEFIPNEIQDNIITLDKVDHHEREGYSVNLESGNYENDLKPRKTVAPLVLHSGLLMTGSVSTDINGAYQNPDLRLVDTLLDVVSAQKNLDPRIHQQRQEFTDIVIQAPRQVCPTKSLDRSFLLYCGFSLFVSERHWRSLRRSGTLCFTRSQK